jgi:hypothetical protein
MQGLTGKPSVIIRLKIGWPMAGESEEWTDYNVGTHWQSFSYNVRLAGLWQGRVESRQDRLANSRGERRAHSYNIGMVSQWQGKKESRIIM